MRFCDAGEKVMGAVLDVEGKLPIKTLHLLLVEDLIHGVQYSKKHNGDERVWPSRSKDGRPSYVH